MKLLQVNHVHKDFSGIRAVDDVSFDVEKGTITALIGPNGAGKTTMVNLITGVLRPTQGNIYFLDKSITGASPFRVASLGIRRTFQTVHLFSGLTVAENVRLGCFRNELVRWPLSALVRNIHSGTSNLESIRPILERFRLVDKAGEIATDLPYGIQRKVEIARALAGSPLLLLLDEPAAGLNDAEREEFQHELRAIRDDGVTVLLIEHDMQLVMSVSDKVVVMNFGRKIAEGTPTAIKSDPAVIASYLGT